MKEMKKTQKLLLMLFAGIVIIALLIVLVFETGLWQSGGLAGGEAQSEFVIMTVMELLTLVSAYLGLRMFKFARIKSDLVNRKSPALKFWGAVRLFLLGTPLLLNTLLYYAYMKATFGYLALILALCLPFVYPSKDRCLSETEDEVAEDKTPEEAS